MKHNNIRSKQANDKLPVVIGKKIYPAPCLPSYHYTEFYNKQSVPTDQKGGRESWKTKLTES